jgi:RNA polymerase sigma factor (sigma-70 family)
MKHPSCTVPTREKLNSVLFDKYEEWACNHARLFKRKHYILCKEIKINELELFALNGLNKAIIRYNPHYIFHKYALIYIYSCLYESVSNQQTMNIIPSYIRKDKNHPWRLKNKKMYLNMIDPIFVGDDDFKLELGIDENNNPLKIFEHSNSINELWNFIQKELDFTSFTVFKYKYNTDFEKVMSNKELSDLMGCSEETIRKNLKTTSEKLKLRLNI